MAASQVTTLFFLKHTQKMIAETEVQSAQLQRYDPKDDLLMYRNIHARRAERENKLAAKNEILKMRYSDHMSWDEIACRTCTIALLIGLALQYHMYLRLVTLSS